ncbi:LAME_0F07250g1_1 [Lachancea meyersii CBS 8951]|uniref:LAME_0F07250g1_1 n=1 Tax=Lachancea meyersii CBS 8951 TaxID=1266667 RepID=A0A1G4JUB6_9SACH|nr:LAME_0F07250g1_1 [Lachancea meyersii CBS 8951]
MGIADDCFNVLLQNKSLRTDQIHELLSKINRHVTEEGISASNLNGIIDFLCENSQISTSTKGFLIKEALIPNGKVPRSTVYAILRCLGTRSQSTPDKLETSRVLQTELCKWLVHVYTYMDDYTVFEETYSEWFQLWQLDFLQHWITYLLFWSTTRHLVRPWRVRLLSSVGANSGYSNAKACATLVLEKFYSLVPDTRIYDAISQLKCNNRRLKTLKRPLWDEVFISRWNSIVKRSYGLSGPPLYSLFEKLSNQLSLSGVERKSHSSETDSGKMVPLNSVVTLGRLAEKLEYLMVPIDVEDVIKTKDQSCLAFIATLEPSDKFWRRLSQWIQLKLKLNSISADTASCCQSISTALITATFLNHEMSLNLSLLDDVNFKFEELSTYKTSEMATNTCSNLEAVRNNPQHYKESHFYHMCRHSLFKNWLLNEEGTGGEEALSCIAFIVSCLSEDMRKSIPSRHLSTTFRLLMIVLDRFPLDRFSDSSLGSCLLPTETVNAMMICSDPIILDAVSAYLVTSRRILGAFSNNDGLADPLNTNLKDLSNYLWSNNFKGDNHVFRIPKGFIRCMISALSTQYSDADVQQMFSVLNIPSLAFPCRVALRTLEEAFTSRVRFNMRLTKKTFTEFKKANSASWLDDVTSFRELILAILRLLRQHEAYCNVAKFLYTYVRSISKNVSQTLSQHDES